MAKRTPPSAGLPLLDGLLEGAASEHGSATASGPELPDAAARQRIRDDLHSNLLVEAGAGSGKTHALASRMAAGIATGAYELERMVAVTFTRKAAAELRGRFQLALEAELQTATDSVAARIHHALGNIERFFAGTIHAFCARLICERPVEAGVAPGFEELDDAQERVLREQSWRDFRTQALAEGDADLLELEDAGLKPHHLDEAFKVICLYDEVDFPAGNPSVPDSAPAWRALWDFWQDLCGYLPGAIPPGSTCKVQQTMDRFRRDWTFVTRVATPDAPPSGQEVAALLAQWDTSRTITQKWWSDDSAERKRLAALIPARLEAFRAQVVTPFLTGWREFVYARAVRVLLKARARAAEDRRRRNVLSFNDLLRRTAELLRTNADVRRAMRRKYRWLFIDEFQDTDPLQAEIIFLLAGEGDEPGAVNWHHVSLRPGALFVVGDPKQSIYRFTRADIDIYNQVRERFAGPDGSGVVTLTANFRSVPAVCDWANQVFASLFPPDATSRSPKYAPLVPVRPPALAEADQGPLLTLTTGKDDAVAVESGQIARFIRSEVDAGRRTFGDFLVITRKKKNLHAYAEALERRGIPVEVSGGSGFSESEDVRQFALLLLALSDPQDQVALLGVLRGPLFGLSDRQIFSWRKAGGYVDLFSSPEEVVAAPAAPVGAALEVLRRWYRWTRLLPAGAALDRILDDSGFVAMAASSAGGVDAGDLRHAVDRVRALVETGFTLFEAARALASWSALDEDGPDESVEVESLPLEPGRPDVVRLMNLHKAKGLEAPVVFLADPTGGFEPRVDVRVVRDAETGTARGWFQIRERLKHGQGKAIAQPEGWDALHEEEKAYLDAEQIRLLYVAATRAREVLVVGRCDGATRAAWAAFEPHLAGFAELRIPDDVRPVAYDTVDLSVGNAAQAAHTIEAAHGRVMMPSWDATSVTAEVKRIPRLSPVEESAEAVDDPTRSTTAETPSRRADAGLGWGSLVHGLLEHAMRFPHATRDDLRRLARWLVLEETSLLAVVEQAIDTVEAVKASDYWQGARRSGEHHEEVPFSVLEHREGQRPVVITGTIDLVHRNGDTWCVVDYKTDVDGALAARYEAQVTAYRAAWGKVVEAPVTSHIVRARL